jgi:hypothetical protein
LTAIVNADSTALASSSLTEIRMLAYVPTSAAAGLPDKLPEDVLNFAQCGMLLILNDSTSFFASAAAVGVKLQAMPTLTAVEA